MSRRDPDIDASDDRKAILVPPIPLNADAITQAATALNLPIPDACMAGVMSNLALLDRHAAILRTAEQDGGA